MYDASLRHYPIRVVPATGEASFATTALQYAIRNGQRAAALPPGRLRDYHEAEARAWSAAVKSGEAEELMRARSGSFRLTKAMARRERAS